jgi:Rps23 Pro-64 3,4-dihydroxylase Tpa1-like proline 4-hydroxylase
VRAVSDKTLDLSSVEFSSEPFPYFLVPQAFSEDVGLRILDWLESDPPWKLIETGFYEQYEFSLLDAPVPADLSFLKDASFLNHLKVEVGEVFNATLDDRVDVTAHKLIPGQRIRIHNDYLPGQETHRLLIQLNRDWADEMGGFLLLFNSADPADVHRVFRPIHNSLVGFAISPDSNHAVSAIRGGERFTLVYSFYGKHRDA